MSEPSTKRCKCKRRIYRTRETGKIQNKCWECRGEKRKSNQKEKKKYIYPTKECFLCEKRKQTRAFEKGYNTCIACVNKTSRINDEIATPLEKRLYSSRHHAKGSEDLKYIPKPGVIMKNGKPLT